MARTFLVALLLAAAYGCSNDGGSTDNTLPGTEAPPTSTSTSSSGSTSAPATTVLATTTAVTPTTEPTTTSSDPTTSQDTSAIETPPSSTDSPLDVTPPERDQLLTAMQRWNETTLVCLRRPDECDRGAVESFGGGPAAARILELVDERLASGVQGLASERATYYVVLDVVVDSDGDSGVVRVCNVNGDIDLRTNDPTVPEDDEIVDDQLVSGPITYSFNRVDERWRAVGTDVGEIYRNENVCPPPGS